MPETIIPISQASVLSPVIALVLWTFVMCGWLYATRIPAINRSGVKIDPRRPSADLLAHIPPEVRWKADNYNHLMEQPTLFYAVSLTMAIIGQGNGLNTKLAWGYVILRIAHSLVQALVNHIMLRFSIFAMSSVVLLIMALRAAIGIGFF